MEIKIFGKTIFESKKSEAPQPEAISTQGVSYSGGSGWANSVFAMPFDGEKDLGEMGQIKRYILDHNRLRYRAWQLYLESDVCQALLKRSATWVVGNGLDLESEPILPVLKMEGITLDAEKFNETVEAAFKVYAKTPNLCDYEGKRSLHEIMYEMDINKDAGGDVLLVLRLVNGVPKVKIIDGANVATPLGFGSMNGLDVVNPNTGNIVRHGIELGKKGEHIAYWVKRNTLAVNYADYERIPARMNKYPYSEMARLVYGEKYRLENVRGIPLITAVMETAAKMGRYREATLGSAEEKAKIAFSIEHEAFSTGENPVIDSLTQASGFYPADLPTDSMGNELANKVAATTNKTAFNMPRGASIKTIDVGNQELNFKDFYTTNFDIVCAVAGYPPEVIMSKYDSNYSASRAAIKDFEHTLSVKRGRLSQQSYQIIYNFWLDVQVLSGKIDAPGYLDALTTRNDVALSAYRNATWCGDSVPHIDPLKEVMAIRAMLGEDSANYPLITMEDAVQMLPRGGDFNAVLQQYSKEIEKGNAAGIEKVPPKGMPQQQTKKDE